MIIYADGNGMKTLKLFAEAALSGHFLIPTPRQFDLLKREVPNFDQEVLTTLHELRNMLRRFKAGGEEEICLEELFDCGWCPAIDKLWLASAFNAWVIWFRNRMEDLWAERGGTPEGILLDSIFEENSIRRLSIKKIEYEWFSILGDFGPVGVVLNYIQNTESLMKINGVKDPGPEDALFWIMLKQSIDCKIEKCIRYVM